MESPPNTYDCGSFVAEWYIAVIRKAVRTLKQAFFATAIHILLQMKGNDYGIDLYESRRLLHP